MIYVGHTFYVVIIRMPKIYVITDICQIYVQVTICVWIMPSWASWVYLWVKERL